MSKEARRGYGQRALRLERAIEDVAQVEEPGERGGASGAPGEMARDPPTVIRCMTGSIAVMRLDQTLGVSRHVACASGCKSKRTSLEEGFKLHRFAGLDRGWPPPRGGGGRRSAYGHPLAFAMISPSSSTIFLTCRLPPTRRYRPGIGSSDAAEQWPLGGRLKLYVCSTNRSRARSALCRAFPILH